MGRQTAIGKREHRREIGPVQKQCIALHNGAWLGPAVWGPSGELQTHRSRVTHLDPAEVCLAIGARGKIGNTALTGRRCRNFLNRAKHLPAARRATRVEAQKSADTHSGKEFRIFHPRSITTCGLGACGIQKQFLLRSWVFPGCQM